MRTCAKARATDGAVYVNFTARRCGRHLLRVNVGTSPISGSPFEVLVLAGEPHGLCMRAPREPAACAEEYGPVEVWAVDKLGNAVPNAHFTPKLFRVEVASASSTTSGRTGVYLGTSIISTVL